MVEQVESQLDFLVRVFDARIIEELKDPDGSLMHGEALLGDTVVMVGKARADYPARGSMNYVFVFDVDLVYSLALKAGGTSLQEPADQYYGMREAGIADPSGNQWWIGTVYEVLSQEEIETRKREMEQNRTANKSL
jgi:PhnB protein